ncbi:GIY-YIG nuclease family protein [Paenibacillus tianjinensis]|uniref:GIY-YIG nuclease family protein n=1 Tax=Paenibacillus tianjinensis TaxID=2810347 RepID=A0ABX7L662_9BACL|nr:GIY-YIG nuclease family protein [Paenibacillus tianjinensis]QSF43464.1 GIY-YIG nuclease family protein [Paenibacillus tianjinensis]
MNLNVSGIYAIVRKDELKREKIYIGSSINVAVRWRTHKADLKSNRHRNAHLQFAWNKYGKEKFHIELLEIVKDKEELVYRENLWIYALNTGDSEHGYNMLVADVNGRTIHSDETRKKMSLNHYDCTGKNNSFFGKTHSNDTRMKISIANKGRVRSIKARQNMSESHPKGEDNHCSKLTVNNVIEIIKMLKDSYPLASIAKKFKVSSPAIASIRDGETWKSVTGGAIECKKYSRIKMTQKRADDIRILYSNGKTITELSKMFNVGTSCINKIVKNQRWKKENK